MKPFFAKVTVETTTDELTELNELIKRDTALAVAEVDDKLDMTRCAACNSWNGKRNKFCYHCGQRQDHENVQL